MPELALNEYQQRALDALQDYFQACGRLGNAEEAFAEVLSGGEATTARPHYRTASAELEGLPYVCLRLPTGAGKTLLASHVPGVALRHLLRADRGVVLWLVTSASSGRNAATGSVSLPCQRARIGAP